MAESNLEDKNHFGGLEDSKRCVFSGLCTVNNCIAGQVINTNPGLGVVDKQLRELLEETKTRPYAWVQRDELERQQFRDQEAGRVRREKECYKVSRYPKLVQPIIRVILNYL